MHHVTVTRPSLQVPVRTCMEGFLASAHRRPHRRVDRVVQILETMSPSPNHRMRRRHVKPRVGNRISKPRLGPAKRLAAGGACVAFGIDAGMLPHHENWREFPVMVSVRFTRLRALRAPQA